MLSPILVRRLTQIFAFVALGLVLAVTAVAQVDTGANSGTVKDTSGGVIPRVKLPAAPPANMCSRRSRLDVTRYPQKRRASKRSSRET